MNASLIHQLTRCSRQNSHWVWRVAFICCCFWQLVSGACGCLIEGARTRASSALYSHSRHILSGGHEQHVCMEHVLGCTSNMCTHIVRVYFFVVWLSQPPVTPRRGARTKQTFESCPHSTLCAALCLSKRFFFCFYFKIISHVLSRSRASSFA